MAKAMKKLESRVYKEQLLRLRARLRGDVSAMADAALSSDPEAAAPIHMADVGSDNFEQENTLMLLENDEETLEKIEAALQRIEKGKYGLCTECGGRVPKMRLNAIPHTPHCVKCAEKIQQSKF